MRTQLNLQGPLWRHNNNDKCTYVASIKRLGGMFYCAEWQNILQASSVSVVVTFCLTNILLTWLSFKDFLDKTKILDNCTISSHPPVAACCQSAGWKNYPTFFSQIQKKRHIWVLGNIQKHTHSWCNNCIITMKPVFLPNVISPGESCNDSWFCWTMISLCKNTLNKGPEKSSSKKTLKKNWGEKWFKNVYFLVYFLWCDLWYSLW